MCRCLSDKDPRRCADPAHRAPYQKGLRGRHSAEAEAIAHVSPPEPGESAARAVNLTELISDLRRVLASEGTLTAAEQAEVANAEWESEQRLLGTYEGMDLAVIAVGAQIASRAEELAGITVQKIRERFHARVRSFEDGIKTAKAMGDEEAVMLMEMALSQVIHGHHGETKKDLRRISDGYQAAVAEHREFGGTLTFHKGSSGKATKAFQEVSELFPADWIAASNAHRALQATFTSDRAHYRDAFISEIKVQRTESKMFLPEQEALLSEHNPGGQWVKTDETTRFRRINPDTGETETGTGYLFERLAFDVKHPGEDFKARKDGAPYGGGWEKWVHPVDGGIYWRKPVTRNGYGEGSQVSQILTSDRTSMVDGRSGSFSVSAHEFSHRSEMSVRSIKGLEDEFLRRRTSFQDPANPSGPLLREELVTIYKGSEEKARPDHWSDLYMGKEYSGNYTEILSMGMESVFAGSFGGLIGVSSHNADLEMRDFILGTLVTAGAPSKP